MKNVLQMFRLTDNVGPLSFRARSFRFPIVPEKQKKGTV